jgi:hypothetical protein
VTARASIEVEEPVLTGQPFRVVVLLESSSARTTRGVTVLLRGFTNLKTSWDQKDEHDRPFGSWSAVLAESERVEEGTHRFEGTLSLPEDAPPSGTGVMEIRYELSARVKMEFPWVFDATATRDLAVSRPPRPERPAPAPVTVSAVGRGSDALFVEVSLDDTAFAPGESIDGAFSLANITDKRVDAATISLVPTAHDVFRGGSDVSVFKSLAGVAEGTAIPFSIPLPSTAALSFPSEVLGVEQAIVVRVDGSAAECRIPVIIDTFARRSGEARPVSSVGRTRWRFAWRDEGTRAGLALEGRDLALHGTLAGAVEARVKPRGNGVHAKLTWESLGVGLSIQPRGLLGGGVALGDVDAAFARRFSARGYDTLQVLTALEADLRGALLAFDEATLDDAGAEVASSASARDPEALRSFLADLEALSAALVAAERRLPPPSWVTDDAAAAWRAFAAATTGRLHAGRMAVTGALVEGDRVDVETRSDARGQPEVTRLTLTIDPPADRIAQLPEGADAALRRSVEALDAAPRVTIRADAVVLELAGSTEDPATLREAMAELARLARRVRGEVHRGPYR